MNVERLQRLKRLLLAEKAWNFDMHSWFDASPGTHFNLTPRDGTSEWADIEPHNFCGTAACALGTAALDPQFQAEGLRLIAKLDQFGDFDGVQPSYRDKVLFEAAQAFFGITYNQAYNLFGLSSLEAPQVAEKIDALLAGS